METKLTARELLIDVLDLLERYGVEAARSAASQLPENIGWDAERVLMDAAHGQIPFTSCVVRVREIAFSA